MSSDFEVGYKKPPKKHQFKKGQSGNPKGKPKEAKNLKTVLGKELNEKLTIKEGGKPKTVSKQTALVKSLIAKAANGDVRAMTLLFNLIYKFHDAEEVPIEELDLTKADKAILENFQKHILKTQTPNPTERDDHDAE
ncbi:MAG: DUF5681 domain-containing protein [Alphaproteobacteria bacterium]